MEHRQVARGSLLVPRRKPAVLLDAVKEALDVVALLVERPVVPAANLPAPGRWNHRERAARADQLEHGVAVVALVGDDGAGFDVCEQDRSQGAVVNVPGCQLDLPRPSLRINASMKLGGISSARNTDCLPLGPPFPPAAC